MNTERSRPSRGPGRPPKDATRSLSTRDAILRSAGRLFSTKGYRATSVIDIAKDAGIQQSSVYYYFENKEAILRSSSGINRDSLAFAELLLENSDPVETRLFDLLYYDTMQLCKSPLDFNEVERLAEEDPEAFVDFWDDYKRLFDIVAALVREGVLKGTFRGGDEHLTVAAMLSLNEGLQKRFRTQERHYKKSGNPFTIPRLSAEKYASMSAMTSLRSILLVNDVVDSLQQRVPRQSID